MKIKIDVRKCEIEKCNAKWFEEDHDPERNVCKICGRDMCMKHIANFKLQTLQYRLEAPFHYTLELICVNCRRDIWEKTQKVLQEFDSPTEEVEAI